MKMPRPSLAVAATMIVALLMVMMTSAQEGCEEAAAAWREACDMDLEAYKEAKSGHDSTEESERRWLLENTNRDMFCSHACQNETAAPFEVLSVVSEPCNQYYVFSEAGKDLRITFSMNRTLMLAGVCDPTASPTLAPTSSTSAPRPSAAASPASSAPQANTATTTIAMWPTAADIAHPYRIYARLSGTPSADATEEPMPTNAQQQLHR